MADIITHLQTVFTVVMGTFSDVLSTITNQPLLIAPVIIGIFGGIVGFAIRSVRKMGLRAGSGRRRGFRR